MPLVVGLALVMYGIEPAVSTHDSTTVVVTRPRTSEQAPESNLPGVGSESLRNAAVAGVVTGVPMGLLLLPFTGEMGLLGAL